jgi:hypothetical protein
MAYDFFTLIPHFPDSISLSGLSISSLRYVAPHKASPHLGVVFPPFVV